ncbi:hypothetical protein T07_7518 [Trichinella nelsoni]|uniref:Uncharacterized protein n=1 Tax=Trichinella nelsoni TaxID=6336 RepID=A0A0V0SJ08_9BILA|nr:hypothetical protein T07_7518 [Trichinella nelsoni]
MHADAYYCSTHFMLAGKGPAVELDRKKEFCPSTGIDAIPSRSHAKRKHQRNCSRPTDAQPENNKKLQ